MNAPDAFALGGTEDLLRLWAEKRALERQIDALPPGADDQPLMDPLIAIEDEIAATVPKSVAGAVVLFKRLREYCEAFDWSEHADQMADNLIAGLEGLE